MYVSYKYSSNVYLKILILNLLRNKINEMYLCIMTYENIKHYKPEEFRRLTGVKPATFAVMVDALRKAYAIKHG
jgi:uncharacterized Fe-S cluster-containing radical SAM superfamily protein